MARVGRQTATVERADDGSGVTLAVTGDAAMHEIVLTWEGAHAARDALASSTHEHASRSIVQRLEDDLDGVMDLLMDENENTDLYDLAMNKGWARGLALAISYMRGSDGDDVRTQAMERWEDRNIDKEESE